MSDRNKVVWSEGLFLRPQHMQQQERYFREYVEGRAGSLQRNAWGLLEFEIDRDLLAVGKIALRSGRGVLPDGTPMSMPEHDTLPSPLEVPPDTRDRIVYLALPVQQSGALDVDRVPKPTSMSRYWLREYEARDTTMESTSAVPLEVACVRARVVLEGFPLEDFVAIPISRVRECRSDRQVLLDEGFMPTTLDIAACAPLARFLQELLGMVKQRADVLGEQVTSTGKGGSAELEDFLRLQVLNRHELLLQHLARMRPVHPEEFYIALLGLAGDLAALHGGDRRPATLPEYLHAQLRLSFEPLIMALRRYLEGKILPGVVSIKVELKSPNAYLAQVADSNLFDSAMFILGVRADMASDTLRRQFPAMATLAPAPKLANLVKGHLSGIGIQPLATLPPRLPFRQNVVYFELDRQHPSWRDLKASGSFGLYIPDGFPGLGLEMWALRP